MTWFPTLRKIYNAVVFSALVGNRQTFLQGVKIFRGKAMLYIKTHDGNHGFLVDADLDSLQGMIDKARKEMIQGWVLSPRSTPTTNHDRRPETEGTTGTRPGWSPELKSRVAARKALGKRLKEERKSE